MGWLIVVVVAVVVGYAAYRNGWVEKVKAYVETKFK